MAGRGRGATLPAWMTGPNAPGSAPTPEQAETGLPAASNPPAETGPLERQPSATLGAAQDRFEHFPDGINFAGPAYSSEVVEAAQAQVLQEQDVALRQALAPSRSVHMHDISTL